MWGEDRGADIDLTNALVSTIAAICLLEMQFGPAADRCRSALSIVPWIIAGGVAIGASFMTKGPCGLPPILGALIWIIIVRIRAHQTTKLFNPKIWLPFLIGASIFALYAFATYRYIQSHHMAADLTGVQEGTQDLHPHDWSFQRAIGWVLLPLVMFLYALPISVALPLSFVRDVRDGQGDAVKRSRMIALAATVLLAWLVCFISGMHLPRYAYVTLPLLCPLAGAVGNAVPKLEPGTRRFIAGLSAATAQILGFVVLGTSDMLWRHSSIRPLLIATPLIALSTAGFIVFHIYRKKPNWRALYALPIVLICLSQNVGYVSHYDRLRRSSRDQAEMIRSITGPDAKLVTCMMVLDQPELFYYTGLPTKAFDGDMLDWHDVRPGTWAVLEDPELQQWQHDVPNRVKRVIPFVANRNQGYLVWYADDSAVTKP
jgi:4-amino-4-deoxy-L-arabinose transferase-like glycosyltransferase